MRGTWAAIYLSLLDMRGDVRRFALVLVCLAVGTALIAGVNSVGASITEAVNKNAALIMGGDVEVSRADRPASADELAAIGRFGQIAGTVDTNVGAASMTADAFVDLIAVGPTYPLFGVVSSAQLPSDTTPFDFLGERDGAFGALVNQLMLDQLGLKVGDSIQIGGTAFDVRGVLGGVPDMNARGFRLGFPALVSTDGLMAVSDRTSPLPGLGTFFRYKLRIGDANADEVKAGLQDALTDGGWSVRTSREGLGPMVRYYDLFMRFLLIAGLASLLIGGVSVGTVISNYVSERSNIIAVFRSIGAERQRVLLHFFAQVTVIAILGIVLGLLVGAGATLLILPLVGSSIGVGLSPTLYPQPLLIAAGAGLLIVFAFSYLPLQRAQAVSPVMLFRSGGAPAAIDWRRLLLSPQSLPLLLAGIAFLWLANLMIGDPRLVGAFAIACAVSAALFVLVTAILPPIIERLPEPENRVFRQALWAISGARSISSSVIIAVGMTLAMLVVVLVLQVNLRNEFLGASVFDAPTFVASDLFQDEADALVTLKGTDTDLRQVTFTPMLRGAVSAIKDQPAASVRAGGPESSFFMSGDIPLTYRSEMPASSRLVAGQWWPADYQGPPLVSLHQSLRSGLGIEVGDKITFDIFGDSVTAQVANFRDYSWQGGVEFLATFSPGALDQYPATVFTAITAVPGSEDALERKLAAALPDVRFIAIGKTLGQVTTALGQLSLAAALVGGLAIANGVLVMVGSLASGRRQREKETVVKKVLGETRREITSTAFIQYALLAAIAVVLAAPLGIGLAYVVSTLLVEVNFSFDAPILIYVGLGTILVTAILGVATIYGAVLSRPVRLLREVN